MCYAYVQLMLSLGKGPRPNPRREITDDDISESGSDAGRVPVPSELSFKRGSSQQVCVLVCQHTLVCMFVWCVCARMQLCRVCSM